MIYFLSFLEILKIYFTNLADVALKKIIATMKDIVTHSLRQNIRFISFSYFRFFHAF